MTDSNELQVQEKQEVTETDNAEQTVPVRYFRPQADIYETDDALTVVMEMPGVTKEGVTVDLENDRLKVEGQIDYTKYDDLEPVYTEYNVGHYRRAFSLSNKIDQSRIDAKLADGVLTLTLPKAEEAKPRQITVN